MKKRREEEHENHERWLVSYADFITLLFAFFVVMYAISSVNEGKYRIVSDSIVSAFNSQPGQSSETVVQVLPATPRNDLIIPQIKQHQKLREEAARRAKDRDELRNKASEIRAALEPLVQQGDVRIIEGASGITVEINASVLFESGEARLQAPAVAALSQVGQILGSTVFPVSVEGHTDNIPISTLLYPSNWELSGARAASVVRLFIATGVAPQRLSAIGYAEQKPVASNDTDEGRQRNRRVAINLDAKAPEDTIELAVP